jgi:hypothetical protein
VGLQCPPGPVFGAGSPVVLATENKVPRFTESIVISDDTPSKYAHNTIVDLLKLILADRNCDAQICVGGRSNNGPAMKVFFDFEWRIKFHPNITLNPRTKIDTWSLSKIFDQKSSFNKTGIFDISVAGNPHFAALNKDISAQLMPSSTLGAADKIAGSNPQKDGSKTQKDGESGNYRIVTVVDKTTSATNNSSSRNEEDGFVFILIVVGGLMLLLLYAGPKRW